MRISKSIQSYFFYTCMLLCLALQFTGCVPLRHEPGKTPMAASFRVVGYAPDYSHERIDPAAYSRVTDLILFSAVLTDDGAFPREGIAALPVARFREIKQQHHVRIHLCFGGWGRSGGFPEMTGDTAKRQTFIETLRQWCLDNDFDGVDYDWEFPANPGEHAAYSTLLLETAEAFHPHDLQVTIALGHTQSLDQAAYNAVDAIHLMTYDMGTRHATERAAQSAVRRLLRSDVPPEKIVLGVPFYGRRMDNRDIAMAYNNILNQFTPSPDEDEAGGFYFNNIETIRRKTLYAQEERLAGIMIWELSMDTNDETSLLAAINEEIES
jgi:chitinase